MKFGVAIKEKFCICYFRVAMCRGRHSSKGNKIAIYERKKFMSKWKRREKKRTQKIFA